MANFMFFRHLLLSFKCILCIIDPSIDYDFLPAHPWLKLLYYTKAQWCICTSLKILSPHSGFSFRDVKPFEVMFPLMHYGGSIFAFQVSVSAQWAWKLLWWPNLHKQHLELFLCAAVSSVSCSALWRIEESGKSLCCFYGCQLNKPFLIYYVGRGFWHTE